MTFTTIGPVRGSCGHDHPTLEAAADCLIRDQIACSGLPGGNSYSDRRIVSANGAALSAVDAAVLDRIDRILLDDEGSV